MTIWTDDPVAGWERRTGQNVSPDWQKVWDKNGEIFRQTLFYSLVKTRPSSEIFNNDKSSVGFDQ